MTDVTLRIGVLAARDLAIADKNGFSDPYVIVRVGKSKYQTPVISKNLNPVWNQVFDHRLSSTNIPIAITATVWDDDSFGRDFLGEITIPMRRLFDRNSGGGNDGIPRQYDDPRNLPAAYTLQKKTAKSNVKGDIVLKFGFSNTPDRSDDDWIYFWEQYTSQAGAV
uniref:C2 and GRAM domain-containing protein At1g03370 n=1 Tax=Anthurium amnicola TaxID=1678845 RepID=A0A1D1XHB5_9ARAE